MKKGWFVATLQGGSVARLCGVICFATLPLCNLFIILGVVALFLSSCQPAAVVVPEVGEVVVTDTAVAPPTIPSSTPLPNTPTPVPATQTASPTNTAEPTSTATATPSPTATPVGLCGQRNPTDADLGLAVTQDFGISRDFEPPDLVPLADYLPMSVTLGYPSEIREVAVEPLLQMILTMQAEGLEPWILSGYRSYAAQAIAWDKWYTKYPDRAYQLSAPPGHSEHQLGTAVDFGTPELAEIVGPDFEFHTYFYKTGVGQWLADHAHEYGFTLSFPVDGLETTGFYYEPWHYRYVGVELATAIKTAETSLIKFQLETHGDPCVP